MGEVDKTLSLLPAIAAHVASLFPELEDRSIAVSEVEPFDAKSNVPTLPMAFTALVSETNIGSARTGGRITLQDDVLIQFLFPPVRYTRMVDKAQTPFFAYYDYEIIRDRMLAGFQNWRTPRGGAVIFQSMDLDSDSYTVAIAFRFRTNEEWCPPSQLPDATVSIVSLKLCIPKGNPCCDEVSNENDQGQS